MVAVGGALALGGGALFIGILCRAARGGRARELRLRTRCKTGWGKEELQ